MATLSLSRIIFTNVNNDSCSFKLDCSNDAEIVENYCQIAQYPNEYYSYLSSQLSEYITEILCDVKNINDNIEIYENTRDNEAKIDNDIYRKFAMLDKLKYTLTENIKNVYNNRYHIRANKQLNLINSLQSTLSCILERKRKDSLITDILSIVEKKTIKMINDKFQIFKIKHYIINNKNIYEVIKTIIYETIHKNNLYSEQIIECLCTNEYINIPSYITNLISQNVPHAINKLITKNIYKMEITDTNVIKSWILLHKYEKPLTMIYNVDQLLKLSNEEICKFVKQYEIHNNGIAGHKMNILEYENNCKKRPILHCEINTISSLLCVFKQVHDKLKLTISDIISEDEINDNILTLLLKYSNFVNHYEFESKKCLFMNHFIKYGIQEKYRSMYLGIYSEFPTYISNNWNLYLNNMDSIDNILLEIKFPNISEFEHRSKSHRQSISVNNEFRNMNLNISSRFDPDHQLKIDNSCVNMIISETDNVITKMSIDSFVPLLRKYIGTIYKFCDEKYTGGENTLDIYRTMIDATINDRTFKLSLIHMNIILAISSLDKPTIMDVAHMVNYNTAMISMIKTMILNGIILQNTAVLEINYDFICKSYH